MGFALADTALGMDAYNFNVGHITGLVLTKLGRCRKKQLQSFF